MKHLEFLLKSLPKRIILKASSIYNSEYKTQEWISTDMTCTDSPVFIGIVNMIWNDVDVF